MMVAVRANSLAAPGGEKWVGGPVHPMPRERSLFDLFDSFLANYPQGLFIWYVSDFSFQNFTLRTVVLSQHGSGGVRSRRMLAVPPASRNKINKHAHTCTHNQSAEITEHCSCLKTQSSPRLTKSQPKHFKGETGG